MRGGRQGGGDQIISSCPFFLSITPNYNTPINAPPSSPSHKQTHAHTHASSLAAALAAVLAAPPSRQSHLDSLRLTSRSSGRGTKGSSSSATTSIWGALSRGLRL